MSITARAGGVSTQLLVRRPSWADMSKYYPSKAVATPTLYDQMIGGAFRKLYDHPAFKNTCAVRMSYALNRSGIRLGTAPSKGGTYVGGDGFKYWIRVKDLQQFLDDRFKGADETLTLAPVSSTLDPGGKEFQKKYEERKEKATIWLDSRLKGRAGIVVFNVAGWMDASGHFTLWDGERLSYAAPHDDSSNNLYYFWLTEVTGELIEVVGSQVVSVRFWELK